MDFSYLLELAKANEEKSKQDSSIKFSTKISNAKKIDRGGPKPQAVTELLNRIEKEKRDKEEEFERKKQNLLAIRAENSHSKKRVRCLINRTKGASKAVLDDAKDIGTAKCETQCDEDDYGYESTMSQNIFSKLQTVYKDIPDDERLKFKKAPKASIEEIKQRVMSSLKEKQEEELGIRKRKRNRRKKHDEEGDGFINDGDEYKTFKNKSEKEEKTKEEGEKKRRSKSDKKVSSDFFLKESKKDKYASFKYDSEKPKSIEKVEKKKNSKSAPPPMSFEELLKVAQKKQVEPLPILDPLAELEKQKEKAKDIERPLTAKEKKELEEARIRRLRRMGKLPPEKPSVKGKTDKEPDSKPEQKVANPSNKPAVENKLQEKSSKNYDKSRFFAVPNKPSSVLSSNNKNVSTNSSKTSQAPSKSLPPPKVSQEHQKSTTPSRSRSPPPYPTKKPPPSYPTKKPSPPYPTKKPHSYPMKKPSPPYPTKKPPSYPMKKPQSLPSKKPPNPAYSPPYFPTRKSGPPPKRRIDSDDEDEYDSEMDDFIDDGEDEMDYSSEIAKMFKYDKSKFRDIDEDDDDASMEASFSQMEKEEKFSAKIGLMEDLEDIRREEEEKKRKKKRMKAFR